MLRFPSAHANSGHHTADRVPVVTAKEKVVCKQTTVSGAATIRESGASLHSPVSPIPLRSVELAAEGAHRPVRFVAARG